MAQTEEESIDWDLVSYVTNSKYRMAIMESLTESPKRPTDIENFDVAHISRALQELREEGLVELLVSEDVKKGRYYGISDEGAKIAAQIENI